MKLDQYTRRAVQQAIAKNVLARPDGDPAKAAWLAQLEAALPGMLDDAQMEAAITGNPTAARAVEFLKASGADPDDRRQELAANPDHPADYADVKDGSIEYLDKSEKVLAIFKFNGQLGASQLVTRAIASGRPVMAQVKNRHGQITHKGMKIGLEPIRPDEDVQFSVRYSPLKKGDELELSFDQ